MYCSFLFQGPQERNLENSFHHSALPGLHHACVLPTHQGSNQDANNHLGARQVPHLGPAQQHGSARALHRAHNSDQTGVCEDHLLQTQQDSTAPANSPAAKHFQQVQDL